ncbi:MAG: MaoC/PaaZ C-terminal domain-containing protein [Pseudomonadota bacterium]
MTVKGHYFDDFLPGQKYDTDKRTITESDLVNFTTSFGFFEPLFMDETYLAKSTTYEGRLVPGTMTFTVAEGLTILSGIIHGTGVAFLGTEMTVLRPVVVGDTIGVDIEVVEKRETKNPERGIVTFFQRVTNQHGLAVMEYSVKRMIRRP